MTEIATPTAAWVSASCLLAISVPVAAQPSEDADEFGPIEEPSDYVTDHPGTCDPYVARDGRVWPGFRLGLSMLLGAQWSEEPVDHVAVGAALSADHVFSDALLGGVRLAYLTGGDAGTDADGDFEDDDDTRNLHLLLASAGPRLRLGDNHYRRGLTALEIDVGAGAVIDASGVGPSGALAEAGVRLLRGPSHLGLRFAQGVGATSRFRALVAEAGFRVGGLPEPSWVSNGCNDPPPEREGGFAHALRGELVVASYAMSERGGVGPPGVALELSLPVVSGLRLALRADAIYYPGHPGDGVMQYGASGGLAFRAVPAGERRLVVSALGGYAVSLGTEPPPFESGPFVDAGVSYELTDGSFPEGVYAGLRTRWGLTEDNERLRTVYATLALDYDGTGD